MNNTAMPQPKHKPNSASAKPNAVAPPKVVAAKAKSPKSITKKALQQKLAEETGLAAKQVALVLDALGTTIIDEVQNNGVFALPGLLKVTKVTKKATPEKQGTNPITKQPMVVKAKPERKVVKIKALKSLKEAV